MYYTASGVITETSDWSKIAKTQFYKYEQIVVKFRCEFFGCDYCSKHVWHEIKLIVKQILCIKLVKYWDKYTEMHGQQNVKIPDVIATAAHSQLVTFNSFTHRL